MFYRINRLLYEESEFVPIRLEDVTDTDVLWGHGEFYSDPILAPLKAVLSTKGGNVMPDFDVGRLPLVSNRLAEALRKTGVDNFQLFDTEITDPRTGVVYRDYKAINIIGAVSCADLDASEYEPSKAPRIDFTKLVIDESRAKGFHMFRLAESLRYILISQKVRDVLVSMPLIGMRISDLDDPDAYVG